MLNDLTLLRSVFTHTRGYICSASMFLVQQSLLKPPCKGLDDDDNEPLPDEPTGLDYSNPWHEEFVTNKESIKANLHLLHPSMRTLLQLCSSSLGSILIVDSLRFR